MKKLSTYILVAALLVVGCKKKYDDTINGQTPDERVAAAMAAYQKKLTSAPYGWILLETTTGTAVNGTTETGPVATFAYFMQFTDSNKVTMFSDFDTVMAAVPKTSDYRVKSLQRPALIFDTYSYIHVPTDPDPTISKSPFGTSYGWGADFEFSFADNVDPSKLGDTITLTGNLNSAKAVMVKATQAQRDAYYNGALKSTMVAWGSIQNYFKRVTGGPTTFELTPGLGGAKSVDVNWLSGTGALQSAATSIYFTAGAVNLVTAPNINNVAVKSFSNIVYNTSTSTITASINGSTAVTIAGNAAPIKVDLNAPSAWWNKAASIDEYWVTETNFHVNGVDDAYGIANTASYAGFSIFWPRFDVFNGVIFDLLSPIVYDNTGNVAINFGAGYRPPTFTAGGTVIFRLYVTLGTSPSNFVSMRNKMAESTGYYLILKEDGLTYDMVNVADAKAWVRWEWVF
ncbi:MAG: DUF4302 domain-containing protein [Chitinophagaceae bacterium]